MKNFDAIVRHYAENEDGDKDFVLSIVRALQSLVTATTADPRHLVRCDEICTAVTDYVFKGRRTLVCPGDAGGCMGDCPACARRNAHHPVMSADDLPF